MSYNSWEFYQTPRCDYCGEPIGSAARPPEGFCNSECQAEYEAAENEQEDENAG